MSQSRAHLRTQEGDRCWAAASLYQFTKANCEQLFPTACSAMSLLHLESGLGGSIYITETGRC